MNSFYDLTVIFERNNSKNRNNDFYFENNYKFKTINIKGLKIGDENIISNGIKNHLKNNKYDLVIMNGYSTFAEIKAIKYLKKMKINYCLYINGGIIPSKECKLKKKIKTNLISNANFYMSPDENSNKYLNYYGAKKENIYNYTYSTIYKNEICCKDLNVNTENVFVASGQLIKRKNIFNLIKSWPNNQHDILLVFGDGKLRKPINKYLKLNNIKNIKMMGFLPRKEMLEYFKTAKAFIFPTNEDIYGHVVLEAMSQGLPVISSKHSNASLKLIKNGYNGFLLNEINKESIENAIKNIDKINKQDVIKTAEDNTIEKMVQDHLRILDHRF